MAAWLDTGICGRTSYLGNYVRDYLEEQQHGCCAICGIERKWNGMPTYKARNRGRGRYYRRQRYAAGRSY
ncbi:hypothetical protein MSEN_25710 [Mycolicibacter senuensis]|uniref:Uncharacterized protein n=1 Tax=Mycolicibacter senuensis TaxID=386913 RepID=A0A7I9XLK6_9MYCO|nr:hypothetical protein MSEN_25710 [Mycolicibacter senuensis]